MPVVLYKIDRSPPCRAVCMVLELIGLKVQTHDLDTASGETLKPEFVAKNPLHTIPVIEDDDLTLADSHAIITYLVSKYGADKAELYPSDLRVRAIVDQRLYLDATILFPRLRAVFGSMVRNKAAGPSEDEIASIEEIYGFLDSYLQKTSFLAADHVTLADLSCVATVSALDLLVPINKKYSKLNEWYSCIKAFDWYQKGNAPGLTALHAYVKEALN